MVLLAVALMAIGTVFAQNQEKERRSPPKPITVEGTLQLQNGFIAVANGDTVYYVGMLHRYIGFIEGLKEGNKATIEGYAYKNFLRPTKMVVGGKTYDFPAMGYAQKAFQRPGYEARPGTRQGHGGYGHGRMGAWQKHRMAPGHRHGQSHKPAPAQKPVAPQQEQ